MKEVLLHQETALLDTLMSELLSLQVMSVARLLMVNCFS